MKIILIFLLVLFVSFGRAAIPRPNDKPTEKRELARYEEAAQAAALAFSFYWIKVPEGLLTKIVAPVTNISFTTNTFWIDTSNGLTNAEPFPETYQQQRLPEQIQIRRQIQTNDSSEEKFLYLQIQGVTPHFKEEYVSEADQQNGITYRGSVSFEFRLYRRFQPGTGWEEWADSIRCRNEISAWLSKVASKLPSFGSSSFSPIPDPLTLNLSILQRDGNWFVDTPSGDRFIKGKRIRAKSDLRTIAPNPGEVRFILEKGRSPKREEDQALADEAAQHPERIDEARRVTAEFFFRQPINPQ